MTIEDDVLEFIFGVHGKVMGLGSLNKNLYERLELESTYNKLSLRPNAKASYVIFKANEYDHIRYTENSMNNIILPGLIAVKKIRAEKLIEAGVMKPEYKDDLITVLELYVINKRFRKNGKK